MKGEYDWLKKIKKEPEWESGSEKLKVYEWVNEWVGGMSEWESECKWEKIQ